MIRCTGFWLPNSYDLEVSTFLWKIQFSRLKEPSKILLYLRRPMHDSQLQSSGYTSSGKAKICKNTQTVKASCKKKCISAQMGIDLVFITGANLSVRVTAPYAVLKLQKFTMECQLANRERNFLR